MNCGGFYGTADFLYWRAENHGFSYGYELTTALAADVASPADDQNVGKVVRVKPDWDPGFRVGLGWNTKHDFWDLFLNYTWYANHTKNTNTSTTGFMNVWAPITPEGRFGTIKGNVHFVMNMGDLEVGRMTYLTKTVAIRPYWGVRGGSINQSFRSHLSELLITGAESGTPLEIHFNGKNKYWGVGPRAGVDGQMDVCYGFSVLGKLAGALLYGKTRANSTSSHILSTADPASANLTTQSNFTDNFDQLVPNLQLSLGLQWQTCFWCEKLFYKMSASWEGNYWWNQFNLPVGQITAIPPIPTVGNQPLTMEGLTLNFELDF